ncbi:MAG TPA: aminotransferase class III-fold pyridoxal phosphate-dependent enzyme, partial [Methylibium sp.]|nr:aminotransferase class III-fold pyridoxal phosphate-dependent enzyme [Methylibium sp.]
LMGVFTPGDHGSTFGGNPLAAAVGDMALQVLVEERLAERAAARGAQLMTGLRALAHPVITDIRGQGLLVGAEIDPRVASARRVCEGLMREGVLSKDTHGTVVRFAPPLVIAEAEIDAAVAALGRVLTALPQP